MSSGLSDLERNIVKEYLESTGYRFDHKDDLWMETWVYEHSWDDICGLIWGFYLTRSSHAST